VRRASRYRRGSPTVTQCPVIRWTRTSAVRARWPTAAPRSIPPRACSAGTSRPKIDGRGISRETRASGSTAQDVQAGRHDEVAGAGDDDDGSCFGCDAFPDHVLDSRLVPDWQHFPGNGCAERPEPCRVPGRGHYRCPVRRAHRIVVFPGALFSRTALREAARQPGGRNRTVSVARGATAHVPGTDLALT